MGWEDGVSSFPPAGCHPVPATRQPPSAIHLSVSWDICPPCNTSFSIRDAWVRQDRRPGLGDPSQAHLEGGKFMIRPK